MRLLHVSAFVLLAACGGAPAPASPPSAPVVATSAPGVVPSSSQYIETLEAPGPFEALPPSLPTTFTSPSKPATVKRSGKTWPFHTWDHAEAVVMNWSAYGPDSDRHAYDELGWTQRLAYRAPLGAEIAQKSVALAVRQGGDILLTKCPVPRHAIVLFDGDTPIASINVDFACQNVLLWPAVPPKGGQALAYELAKELVPEWRDVFEGQLHFPMWKENP